MKIAYVTKTPWGENSPGFIFSYFQARGIAENNLNVTLFMKTAQSIYKGQRRIDQNPLPNLKVKLFKGKISFLNANEIFYHRVKKYILDNKYDIVFTRDPGFLKCLYKIKRKLNNKTFYQSHNFYMDFNLHEYIQSNQRKKFHNYEKKYINNLNALMTLNHPQKKLYEKYVKIPVETCHPGLHPKKSSFGNFKNRKIIYSGSFQKLKGIEEIVSLWEKTKLKKGGLSLIGGRNKKELDYVFSLVDKSAVKNIDVKGWMEYSSLMHQMKNASIGLIVLPNQFYNQYLTAPSKLYDFISCGLPVICTYLPSTKDLIPKNHKGVKFIKPGDTLGYINAIKKFSENKKEYEDAQQSNIELSSQITWAKMTKHMVKIFKQ